MERGQVSSVLASAPAVACMKTLLMIFNFIFWITGIAILALGIWTKVDLYRFMELSTVYYNESPFVLIGVGAVIVLVGSLGCCCTVKGNAVLLYMYSGFLILVFVIELSAGIAGFAYKQKLNGGFNDGLKAAIKVYGKDKVKTSTFDDLQTQLHCCGISNYTDWFPVNGNKSVPSSCCKSAGCSRNNLPLHPTNDTKQQIYTEGCYTLVVSFMEGNMGLIGGVALGISFFQLIGALLACCLAKNINKSKYEQVA